MSLLTGFYYNLSRKIMNSNMDYLLLSEGNRINIDSNSVFGLWDIYPDYVIFTELGGTSICKDFYVGNLYFRSRIDEIGLSGW